MTKKEKIEKGGSVNEAMEATLAQVEHLFANVTPKIERRSGPGEAQPMTLKEAISILRGVKWEKPFELDDAVRGSTEEGDKWTGSFDPLGGFFQLSNISREPLHDLDDVYYSSPDQEIGWEGYLEIVTGTHIIGFRLGQA